MWSYLCGIFFGFGGWRRKYNNDSCSPAPPLPSLLIWWRPVFVWFRIASLAWMTVREEVVKGVLVGLRPHTNRWMFCLSRVGGWSSVRKCSKVYSCSNPGPSENTSYFPLWWKKASWELGAPKTRKFVNEFNRVFNPKNNHELKGTLREKRQEVSKVWPFRQLFGTVP